MERKNTLVKGSKLSGRNLPNRDHSSAKLSCKVIVGGDSGERQPSVRQRQPPTVNYPRWALPGLKAWRLRRGRLHHNNKLKERRTDTPSSFVVVIHPLLPSLGRSLFSPQPNPESKSNSRRLSPPSNSQSSAIPKRNTRTRYATNARAPSPWPCSRRERLHDGFTRSRFPGGVGLEARRGRPAVFT